MSGTKFPALYRSATPEGRPYLCKLLRSNVYLSFDQPLEVRGIFANIKSEVETTVCSPANSGREAFQATNPWPSNSAQS